MMANVRSKVCLIWSFSRQSRRARGIPNGSLDFASVTRLSGSGDGSQIIWKRASLII